MKTCRICDKDKPESEFRQRSLMCKQCAYAVRKPYFDARRKTSRRLGVRKAKRTCSSVSHNKIISTYETFRKSANIPEECELCGRTIEQIKNLQKYNTTGRRPNHTLVGHHWNGHDNPLDVWWVCYLCNRKLMNRHDGSLSKEQARDFCSEMVQNTRKSTLDIISPAYVAR